MSTTFLRNLNSRNCTALLILSLLFVATVICAMGVGRYGLSPVQVLHLVFEGVSGTVSDPIAHHVIFGVRGPRILTAAAVGAALALSGCALQSIFRNPLVSPNILGISSGAAFGGTLAIFFGLSSWALYGGAVFFGMSTLILVYLFSKRFKEGLLMLILGGMILNGVFSALVGLMQYLSDSEDKLPLIVFWLMGSFNNATLNKFLVFLGPFVICAGLMIAMRWRLNLLSLDDKNAKSLGVNVGLLRWIFISCCGILISTQVAVSGNVSWVGLIIPHMSRFIVGSDNKVVMPASALIGAIFLVLTDTVARTASQAEIPISILTALVGAPIFAVILIRLRQRGRGA